MEFVQDYYNYWMAILLMMIGFYGVIAKRNLVKQAIALGLFQTGVFLFFISMGVRDGGTAPVWKAPPGDGHGGHTAGKMYGGHLVTGADDHGIPANNPLDHVLILTAIVVSVAILAVALALIVNVKRAYGTIEEDEILALEAQGDNGGAA